VASAARREITVRHGKGGKDWRTMLPAVVTVALPGRRQVVELPGRSIPECAGMTSPCGSFGVSASWPAAVTGRRRLNPAPAAARAGGTALPARRAD
jgi:hypothetical protein